jgi:hypothetical protein
MERQEAGQFSIRGDYAEGDRHHLDLFRFKGKSEDFPGTKATRWDVEDESAYFKMVNLPNGTGSGRIAPI